MGYVIFVSMVEVVSARVDEETRRKMRRLRHVNWSEVVREAIQEKIRLEDRRRVRDAAEVEEALHLMDSIRRPHPGLDGTEEIRKWRDLRR
jgi:transcriptional regulator of met regulon